MPIGINDTIMKPILKDSNKNPSCISNIKPISLLETLARIYERLILVKLNEKFIGNPKQFGFKNNSSSSQLVLVLVF